MAQAAFLAAPPSNAALFATHRTLILNADYHPLGYPLETLNAEDTLKGYFLGRFDVVSWSETWAHSPTTELRLPSVVALKSYIPAANLYGTPSCNLHNLFVRDRGLCQYTGQAVRLQAADKAHEATMDHVIPKCQAGAGNWDNVVLASWPANNKKGHLSPEKAGLSLLSQPWVPSGADLLYLWLTEDRLAELPTAWHDYLKILRPTPRLLRVLERLQLAA
jgi:5-methylcytosine-specific restriction endonuclease McrA